MLRVREMVCVVAAAVPWGASAQEGVPMLQDDDSAEEVEAVEEAPAPEYTPEGYAIVFREPSSAMFHRRCMPVEITIQKSWKLTPAEQLERIDKRGRHIRINLAIQHGFYMDGTAELLNFSVCSGKKSTPTPQGHYHIIEKDKEHKSNLHNNASMPFFLRLTLDGVGLHQGPLMGYPSSHGCIRLGATTAQRLFKECEVGTPVFVYHDSTEAKPKPPKKTTPRRKR